MFLSAENSKTAPRRHKFQVSDSAIAAKLIVQGAKPLADYDGFKIFDAADVDAKTLAGQGGEIRDDYDSVFLHAGTIDTTTAQATALKKAVGNFAGKKLHLIQFIGPPKPEWHEALAKTGVRIVSYIPENSYLVYGDAASLAGLQAHARAAAHVQWEAPFLDDYKIHPKARLVDKNGNAQQLDTDTFAIQLVADANANAATLQLIDRIKLAPIIRQYEILDYVNVIVRIPAARLADIAAQPEVVSIHPYHEPKKRDERQDQIIAGNLTGTSPTGPGYLAWLATKGFTQAQFTASGFSVDVSDSGIDNGTAIPGHFGLYLTGSLSNASRVIYNRLEGSANSGSTLQGCDGHGTLNSHIIGGYNNQPDGFPHTDSAGFHYGLGVCPFVKVGSSVIFDPNTFTSPNYPNLQSRAYNNGARVSNNSWGGTGNGAYDSDAQAYDALVRDAQPSGSAFATAGNQEMTIVFAAGNDGSAAGTVGSPGTAKNVFTIGASENVHSHSTANGGNNSLGNDGCSSPDTDANSANDVIGFSSRGPCDDGRHKPDICAPGTHITGGVAQSSPAPLPTSTGNDIACFKGDGVCGLPGGGTVGSANNFFPLGQQFYTTSSGTSHSTPCVAGGCALLRQYFINNSLAAPSPAMTKAFLMNSARYLSGVGANDSLYSDNQGMGDMNLGFAFDGVSRILRDEVSADKFTASGQTHIINNRIADPTKPFRVTLAWTDAPGNTAGNSFNNNLDLTVTIGGNTYKGNVFSGANSVTGGTADTKNNVESVFLPAGVSGNFTVTVTGTSINSDGVPNEAPSLDQDYALVIYNTSPPGALIVGSSAALVAEECVNGVIDSGEAVTVNFALKNSGATDTTNVVATLLSTGGITSPSAAQSYGTLSTNGITVTNAFSFVATSSCGSTITATFQLQDGTNDLGTVSFNFVLGLTATNFSQTFDGVTAPALPSGWTTTKSGSESPWVTTTAQSSSSPNSAFVPDPNKVGIGELISPVITATPGVQLSFRHNYNLEASSSGTVGYDGGVLEIKIGSGAYADIVTAGGSFASGGYTHTISTGFSSGLAGRAAWSGNSAGFVTTVVNLPPSAAGQNVQFNWRCGSDSSTAATGWYVDSVMLIGYSCCTAPQSPFFTAQPQNFTGVAGTNATFNTVAGGGTPLAYQWRFNGTNISSATVSTLVITNIQSANAGTYSVVVSNSAGTLASSNATLTVNVPPGIAANPQGVTTNQGQVATFAVTATGTTPFGYRWRFNGLNISGATASNYSRTNAQCTNAGSYDVVVTNIAGSVTSGVASLTVISPPTITVQPQGQTRAQSTSVSFSVAATNICGGGSVYQWRFNAANISSATASGYSRTNLQCADAGSFDVVVANAAGSLTSSIANLVVVSPPSISAQPADQAVIAGNSATFNAAATNDCGSGLAYQWRFNATNISGATGSGFTLTNAQAANAGSYSVTVTNLSGGVTSSNAVLTVNIPPFIQSQPQNREILPGEDATFSVTAGGTPTLNYQWRFNAADIASATQTAFTRFNAQSNDIGGYDVVVTNIAGSVTSAMASLNFVTNPVLLNPHFGSGAFQFTLSGNTGRNYLIEQGTEFTNWSGVTTVTNVSGQVLFSQPDATSNFFQMFRAKLVP